MIILYIISIIVYLALIFVTMNIAGQKGRSVLGFGLLAVFVPLIALIIVLIIGPAGKKAVVSDE